jgi:hypothetical protein
MRTLRQTVDLWQWAWAQSTVPAMISSVRVPWEIYRRVNGMIRFPLPRSLTEMCYARYANMDYLFLNSIRQTELVELVISYDIACQWSKNLRN